MTQKDQYIDFEHIIDRLTYPVTKEDIVDAARTHGATNSAVAIAEELPNETFNSPGKVLEKMRK